MIMRPSEGRHAATASPANGRRPPSHAGGGEDWGKRRTRHQSAPYGGSTHNEDAERRLLGHVSVDEDVGQRRRQVQHEPAADVVPPHAAPVHDHVLVLVQETCHGKGGWV